MEVKYNVTGTKRWELVRTISRIMDAEAEYKGTPTFAYQAGPFTVTRDGTLVIPDGSDPEIVRTVLDGVSRAGFECEQNGEIEWTGVSEGARTETSEDKETIGLTISMPRDKVDINNLNSMLKSKGTLIKKALGISGLPVEVTEDEVSFPWFPEVPDPDSAKIYTDFIAAICRMTKEQQRVSPRTREVENDKYAFRCFLLRLGYIGDKYKADRKVLLKNLSGSSAFKGGPKDEDAE